MMKIFFSLTVYDQIVFFFLNNFMTKIFSLHIKISYYFFNRQFLIFQKAKDRHHNCGSNEKAAEYYIANKEVLKENAKTKYRNLSEEEKELKGECGKDRWRNMTENKNKLKEY